MISRKVLENLKNKKISIMLNIPRAWKGNETYVGYIESVEDGYVTFNPLGKIDRQIYRMYVAQEAILSIWEYREQPLSITEQEREKELLGKYQNKLEPLFIRMRKGEILMPRDLQATLGVSRVTSCRVLAALKNNTDIKVEGNTRSRKISIHKINSFYAG